MGPVVLAPSFLFVCFHSKKVDRMKLTKSIKAATADLDKLVSSKASVRVMAQNLMGRHAKALEEMEAIWSQCCPPSSKIPQSLLLKLAAYQWARRHRKVALCDHNYIDVSDAGPNSGDMDFQCCKCGHYVSAQLY
jgi:hypothetical protein